MDVALRMLRVALLAVLLVAAGPVPWAAAQNVADLSSDLQTSRSEKVRLSAAVALGRLRDSRGVPVLVDCLESSRSPVLRGVCATALGQIGDPKARPALTLALADPSVTVRKRARRALSVLNNAAPKDTTGKGRAAPIERGRYQVTPRENARPRVLYVTGSVDKGVTGGTKRGRELTSVLVEDLTAAGVPSMARTEGRLPQGALALDASVTTFSARRQGANVDLACEIRITISDAEGRILGTVTGRATTQARANGHKGLRASRTERELLVGAVQGARARLVDRLEILAKR